MRSIAGGAAHAQDPDGQDRARGQLRPPRDLGLPTPSRSRALASLDGSPPHLPPEGSPPPPHPRSGPPPLCGPASEGPISETARARLGTSGTPGVCLSVEMAARRSPPPPSPSPPLLAETRGGALRVAALLVVKRLTINLARPLDRCGPPRRFEPARALEGGQPPIRGARRASTYRGTSPIRKRNPPRTPR